MAIQHAKANWLTGEAFPRAPLSASRRVTRTNFVRFKWRGELTKLDVSLHGGEKSISRLSRLLKLLVRQSRPFWLEACTLGAVGGVGQGRSDRCRQRGLHGRLWPHWRSQDACRSKGAELLNRSSPFPTHSAVRKSMSCFRVELSSG